MSAVLPGPAPRPSPAPVVAAFDVDGTLTTRDCVVPFVRYAVGTSTVVRALARRLGTFAPALARRDRDALKAIAASAVFRGVPLAALVAEGERFAVGVHRDWMRTDTVVTLDEHLARGHVAVLVSASFGVYLRPLARRLGVDHVLATELEVDGDGRCTGRLDGGNCRGPAKVTRLHAWLDDHFGGRGEVELWAYGDSAGDRELLADADHATWVSR